MKIVVGLGNPGEKYKETRHNVGFLFLDKYLDKPTWSKYKNIKAVYTQKNGVIFIKPQSFMNLSGSSVYQALKYHNLLDHKFLFSIKRNQDLSKSLLVIQDELDLDLGSWKISSNISSGGHKGLESIIQQLKTKNFSRLRFGVANDKLRKEIPADKFVLQKFSESELKKLEETFSASLDDFLSELDK